LGLFVGGREFYSFFINFVQDDGAIRDAEPAGRIFARFSAQLAPGKWVAPNADRDRRRNEAKCRKSPACSPLAAS
jgi:hypothetical protein